MHWCRTLFSFLLSGYAWWEQLLQCLQVIPWKVSHIMRAIIWNNPTSHTTEYRSASNLGAMVFSAAVCHHFHLKNTFQGWDKSRTFFSQRTVTSNIHSPIKNKKSIRSKVLEWMLDVICQQMFSSFSEVFFNCFQGMHVHLIPQSMSVNLLVSYS